VVLIPDMEDVVAHLLTELKAGDVVLTLGAGDIWKAGIALIERLKER